MKPEFVTFAKLSHYFGAGHELFPVGRAGDPVDQVKVRDVRGLVLVRGGLVLVQGLLEAHHALPVNKRQIFFILFQNLQEEKLFFGRK